MSSGYQHSLNEKLNKMQGKQAANNKKMEKADQIVIG